MNKFNEGLEYVISLKEERLIMQGDVSPEDPKIREKAIGAIIQSHVKKLSSDKYNLLKEVNKLEEEIEKQYEICNHNFKLLDSDDYYRTYKCEYCGLIYEE